MHIRSDDKINKVIVADNKTGYAIAEFYYQAGKDQKLLFDALKNARQFIKMKNKKT